MSREHLAHHRKNVKPEGILMKNWKQISQSNVLKPYELILVWKEIIFQSSVLCLKTDWASLLN